MFTEAGIWAATLSELLKVMVVPPGAAAGEIVTFPSD